MEEINYCNTCPQETRGLCCYNLRVVNPETGMIIYKDPCKYLNKAHRCRIYKKRHELNPYCLSIEDAIKFGSLPGGCKYLENTQKAII